MAKDPTTIGDSVRRTVVGDGPAMPKTPANPMPFTAPERKRTSEDAVGRFGSMIDVDDANAKLPGKKLSTETLNTLASKDNQPARPLNRKPIASSRAVRGRR